MLYLRTHSNLLFILTPSSVERSVFATLLDRRSSEAAVGVEAGCTIADSGGFGGGSVSTGKIVSASI